MPYKYLRDLGVRADPAIVDEFGGLVGRFNRNATCISERFRYGLSGKQISIGIPRIWLKLVDHRMGSIDFPKRGDLRGAGECRWPFDFMLYQDETDLNKKLMIESVLHECLTTVGSEWDWDLTLIRQIHDEFVSEKFTFSRECKASWPSPDSKFRVRVAFDWQLDQICFQARLYRNRSSVLIVSKELGWLRPSIGQLDNTVGQKNGSWASSTEFVLQTSDFAQKKMSVDFTQEMNEPSSANK
jgi:hypothetical protein